MTHPDALVDGLRCAPGTPFFHWLVTRLREALDVRYAFIGEFTGDDATRLHVLATSEDTHAIDHTPYVYELDGTPAAEPPDADGFHWCPEHARTRFPGVPIYEALGIESIACLRLSDDDGRPLGLLGVLDTRPFRHPEHVRRMLLGVRARASGDLELRRVQREQRLLTETAAAARSNDALLRLVEQLARALDVHTAFVSELLDDPPRHARTLAIWERDGLAPNVEYALADTPCALVYERDVVLHTRDLQRLYPRDAHVQRTGAQAYLGVALHDRHGQPIGHVGVLHNRPLHEGLRSFPLLHVLASLAAKEIERLRAARRPPTERTLLPGEVAHDFNNLLTGILAHSDLALHELSTPEALRVRLEAIQATAQRAADLARDMLDAADSRRSSDEPVDLGALAHETAALLGPAIPPNVRVEFDVEPGLPPMRGNPTQLRQIVMNLLLNAGEAVGDRPGRVQVRVGRGANGCAGWLQLTVSDTGVGMTPAMQARIFEPAFTTKARGRGIGLAIVRKLVDAHRGTITVRSTPRVGTEFTVSFPAGSDEPARAPTRPAPGPVLERPLRALLVDDDEGVRLTTAHMLRRLGCEVVPASDGEAALAILDANAAALHVVLLDMAMPGMSGEDLAATVRQRWPLLPIVVMSGYATQDLSRRLAQHTSLHFLQKPFGLDALRSCLAGLQARTARATSAAKPTRAHA
ncbi:MAG TPA: ATP-binding protein [Candidatus Limnocylindria bacterium]|nr:ATP-binding protein [Candidatus Limnocylindria bacterium]